MMTNDIAFVHIKMCKYIIDIGWIQVLNMKTDNNVL